MRRRESSLANHTHGSSYPIIRELPADFESPASVYTKLANDNPSFLLESVTGGEQVARYSFIGIDLHEAFVYSGTNLSHHTLDGVFEYEINRFSDPFTPLRKFLSKHKFDTRSGLPRFSGGLVGYLSYEMIRYFEPSVKIRPHTELPDAIFLVADTLIAFDHAFGRIMLIANLDPGLDPEKATTSSNARLDKLEERLSKPLILGSEVKSSIENDFTTNISQKEYQAAVLNAKELITAGDIFQVVLSQRLGKETLSQPFDIYRALRRLNPSPYMFFFSFGKLSGDEPLHIIGASPEMHVRLENGIAALRPIAGTRKRGDTPQHDENLEEELLTDPKERAEHVMLVDLARNDLGRVCEYGSVNVTDFMQVERYSHVMHIVSHVEGRLRPEFDSFDLLTATFPAGTVSGAPKIRAMQIIEGLEKTPRGPYAGAVGYFSYDGSLDTCIAIRTLIMQGNRISVQAGAGIVADSDPRREYEETLSKAKALAEAVNMAEGGK